MSLLIKGGTGITKLSQLEIDADKDWLSKGITNIKAIAPTMAHGDIVYRGRNVLEKLAPDAGKGYSFLKSRGPGMSPVWEDIESLIQYMTGSINRAVAFDLPIAEPRISLATAGNHAGGGFTSNQTLVIPATAISINVAEDHSGGGLTSQYGLLIPTPTLGRDASCIYERHQTGDDASLNVYGANWEAQSFTPGIAHNINRVHLKVRRLGTPGMVTLSIRATTSNLPSGADLTGGTFDANTLPTDRDIWVIVSLTSHALVAGTRYAIVARAPDCDANNYLAWRADATSPLYANGARCYSANSGASWIEDTTRDYIFEEGFGN